ncbi:hypothetical protein TMPK1_15190 [Rhodospirillales bacterium TMPK1]|uniref:Uncharacterized protein n=2 Tax=Roseiterribacter gracilis TaxID=2812848 RepID=A0A8S8XB76_9PROT|nr:hypothetical protein TMPK1_15190 [Rhodospirillales bacterium TMPK1]
MGLALLTLFHTALSIVALLIGIVVVADLMQGTTVPRWNRPFLITAIATSLTGFFFPITQILPSHIVGGVALVVLAGTLLAQFTFGLRGAFRSLYIAGLVASEFFLTFVLVAQLYLRVPGLHALAPTGSEPAFGITQLVVLLFFVYAGFVAVRRARSGGMVGVHA